MDQLEKRGRAIIRTSIIGIGGNVLLAAFKAAVGIISSSIAITLDSVNNLSDAASSVITIIGTKLAAKPADKKHPFGYGRLEYLTAMLIAVIILYAGVTSLVESVKKIIFPVTPAYSRVSFIILAAAVIVKILMGLYVRKVGRTVNSDALVASGQDALMDSIISAATIAAAAVYIITGISVEAYLGAAISLLILKTGFDTLHEAISEVLGERVDAELARKVKETISGIEGIHGVYDLVLTNYGPDKFLASVHVEVDDATTAAEIDRLQWKISKAVLVNHGITMSAVGVYPSNTGNSMTSMIKKKLRTYLAQFPEVLELHGLYLDEEENFLRMDVILDFDAKDRMALYERIKTEIAGMFPEYKTFVQLDLDVSAL